MHHLEMRYIGDHFNGTLHKFSPFLEVLAVDSNIPKYLACSHILQLDSSVK